MGLGLGGGALTGLRLSAGVPTLDDGGAFERATPELAQAILVERIRQNIHLMREQFREGSTPEIIGTVCGSAAAKAFWQERLEVAARDFRAHSALSLHEDLPTNQAFGLLLAWQRLQPYVQPNSASLVSFVFGDGKRAAPFTAAECAQKPNIASFATVGEGESLRYLSTAELSLRAFVPVQQFLQRSGFKGLVVKWGDEVQVPARSMSGYDPLFKDADVVRFVSLRRMNADEAANKDWVGVDQHNHITLFIPRRSLEQMEPLADRGLIQRRADGLYGGVNLGSIAVSYALNNCLLAEFKSEVNDPTANRKERPALDPEFFTALTVAAIKDTALRAETWERAKAESPAVAQLDQRIPSVLPRLVQVIARLEQEQQRPIKLVALDFEDQYWGDIGQHAKMFDFYMALNRNGVEGEIARALAGIGEERDRNGNILVNSYVGPNVEVRNSVLLNAKVHSEGQVQDSVLIGTRAKAAYANNSFDVLSTAGELRLEPRAGSYKVIEPFRALVAAGERLTMVFSPEGESIRLRVHEDTDLSGVKANYESPILGNVLSFAEAHRTMAAIPLAQVETWRRQLGDALYRSWLQ